MDSNIDESITKIYEQEQTMSGSEEEAMQFLKVLDNHKDVNVNIEGNEIPIKIPLKSWKTIIEKIPEEQSYSLAYICFSLVNEVQENEIWGIRKNGETNDAEVFQDVFFNTVLEASVPHEIPFTMCEEDFSQFTDYFNQKEADDRNIKLSNEDWIKENIPKEKEETEAKEKDKEDENQNLTEVKKEIIEDKDGVKKIVTTKTVTSSQTIYKKKIQPTKEKEKEKIINIPPEPKEKEKEKEELKPIIQKEEPQSKIVRKKPIVKEGKEKKEKPPKEEEIVYRVVKQGRFRPKTKVLRKKKDPETGNQIEDEIINDEIIYDSSENKPNAKILRKKIMSDGKEEIEEVPNKKVIYMVNKFGKSTEPPQSKIKRKNIISKDGKVDEKEEDIPGDELIIKTIKEEPNKEIKKIIIKKDGKIRS